LETYEVIEFILTALIFFTLGWVTRRPYTKDEVLLASKNVQKRLRTKKVSTGTHKVLTPKERRYKGSNEEAVDKEMNKLLKRIL